VIEQARGLRELQPLRRDRHGAAKYNGGVASSLPLLTVGVGVRSYNASYSYAGLDVPGVRFVRAFRVPFNRIAPASHTALNTVVPLDPRLDLLHLMNGVSTLGLPTPWVTSFESMLPRLDAGHNGTWVEHRLVDRLLDDRCRRLLAWSRHATLRLGHQHPPDVVERLLAKTEIFAGSTGAPVREPKRHSLPLRIAFVGGQRFIGKGGVAVLRAFDRIRRAGHPIELEVVGTLELTELAPPADGYAEEANALAEGVVWHPWLDQAAVHALLERSHVAAFPSLSETYGWLALEAMQRACVPVVSGIVSLREIVGEGGVVLDLPLGELETWAGLDVALEQRAPLVAQTLAGFTDQLEATLIALAGDAERYERLSATALDEYRTRFDPVLAAERLRGIYDRALVR
jgi:glycosyltransferase involved in cell wall biosynthesis